MGLGEVQIKLRNKYLFCSKMNTIYLYKNIGFGSQYCKNIPIFLAL